MNRLSKLFRPVLLVVLLTSICRGQQTLHQYRLWSFVRNGTTTTEMAVFDRYSSQASMIYFERRDGSKFRVPETSLSDSARQTLINVEGIPLVASFVPAAEPVTFPAKPNPNEWGLQNNGNDIINGLGLLIVIGLFGRAVFLLYRRIKYIRKYDAPKHSAPPPPSPAFPHTTTPEVEVPLIQSDVRFCSGCGTPYSQDPSNAFCSKCGRQFLHATTADTISSLSKQPPLSAPHAAKYPGISRLTYFLGFIGAHCIYGMIIGAGWDKGVALLVLAVMQFILLLPRLRNTGTNLWFSLLGLIPVVGMIVMVRCLACQEGYQQTKKLDRTGKVIAGIVIGAFCIGLVVAIVIPHVMK